MSNPSCRWWISEAPGGFVVGEQEMGQTTWAEYYASKQRITETNHINKGLLTLKRCIHALNENQTQVKQGREPLRVPFRDSRLTQLLEPALNAHSRTSITVCCSRADVHAEETVQSLRFGQMCSRVEHERTTTTIDTSTAMSTALQQIDAELKTLEADIRSKERWEWRSRIERHVVDEKDTGGTMLDTEEEMELGGKGAVEIKADDGTSKVQTVEHEVWGQVLVGAELENQRRDELLRQRQRLLGEKIQVSSVTEE